MKTMNAMKKFLTVMSAAAVAAAMLTGCGSTATRNADTGNTEKVYKIGVLQYADHPSLDNCRDGFVEGLKAEGFEEGKNLKIDAQSAKADDSTNTLIAQKFAAD